jgi:hypothetical protein
MNARFLSNKTWDTLVTEYVDEANTAPETLSMWIKRVHNMNIIPGTRWGIYFENEMDEIIFNLKYE